MTKIIFLLPPSEGKNKGWDFPEESLSFDFKKPSNIAKNATEKDLKCKDVRYAEWIALNKKCVTKKGEYMRAIERYSGVMYNAIWHGTMFESGKKYFEENILVLSWMYGVVKPTDTIWNYKLPIETKWLLAFWEDQITNQLNILDADYIVNLLPLSYQKMINFPDINAEIIHVNFYTKHDWELKKMTHWVKKVKWEWLREICESGEKNYNSFWGVVINENWKTEVQIIKK